MSQKALIPLAIGLLVGVGLAWWWGDRELQVYYFEVHNEAPQYFAKSQIEKVREELEGLRADLVPKYHPVHIFREVKEGIEFAPGDIKIILRLQKGEQLQYEEYEYGHWKGQDDPWIRRTHARFRERPVLSEKRRKELMDRVVEMTFK